MVELILKEGGSLILREGGSLYVKIASFIVSTEFFAWLGLFVIGLMLSTGLFIKLNNKKNDGVEY